MKPIQELIVLSPEASMKLTTYLDNGLAHDDDLSDEQLFARDCERRLQAIEELKEER